MKYVFLIISLFLTCTTASGQIVVRGGTVGTAVATPKGLEKNTPVEGKEIDKSKVVVVYSYSCKTQNADGQDVTDRSRFVLQVGNKVNKFYPYDQYLQNFEFEKVTDKNLSMEDLSTARSLSIPDVWTNYPEGKVTTRDAIFPNYYETETKKPTIKWDLKDGTSEQCGYTCNEAECEFHGKSWKVYYTEEIPTTAGPWKLGGLPGLIVSATDAEGIHQFKLELLENASTPILLETVASVIKVSEKKLMDYKKEIYGNPKYLKDAYHYVPDWHSHIESLQVFQPSKGTGTISVNDGKFFLPTEPHAYQPLELQ